MENQTITIPLPWIQTRRKSSVNNVKTWFVVTKTGESRVEEIGKQSMMIRTGLPARELRMMDPLLSYPPSILGRERAIVVNLEHIRAIITAREVLVLHSINPLVSQFVQELSDRIYNNYQLVEVHGDCKRSVEGSDKTTNSPFEFQAFEVCIESACKCLEMETNTLEREAYPALDELTTKISTLKLEQCRQIKSHLVGLSGRVQKLKEEFEHLLDDENDMAELYLSEKLRATAAYNDASEKQSDEYNFDSSSQIIECGTLFKPNVDEIEMLLGVYFAQLDGVSQKISHVSDYVDDTEDFINIMLNDKQNQLLQMGVLMNTADLILNVAMVVVGIFGMNIHITLYDHPINFLHTVIGTIGGCAAMYGFAVRWAKRNNLLSL